MNNADAAGLSFLYRQSFLYSMFTLLFMNGIYTALVIGTLRAIVTQKSTRTKVQNRIMITIILFMYSCSIVHMAIRWRATGKAYLADSSDETLHLIDLSTAPIILTIGGSTAALLMITADSIMVWRCWSIWNYNWKVLVAPLVLLLVTTASKIVVIVQESTGDKKTREIRFVTVFLATSLATSLLATFFIVGRLLPRRVPGMGTHWKAIEILVESAALYSITLIVYIALWVSDDPVVYTRFMYLQCLLVPISGIAPTLIVGRVAAGRAIASQAWKRPAIVSNIHFRSMASDGTNTQDISTDGTSTTATGNIDDTIFITEKPENETRTSRQSESQGHQDSWV